MMIPLAGEQIRLFPERGMFWERCGALFIADVHWGKAATFRARALPIPESGEEDLQRLDQLILQTQPNHLYILGDLLHAKVGRTPSMLAGFAEWRSRNAKLDMTLVRGNHDRHAGDPPENWNIRCVDAPFTLAPFVLLHEPTTAAPKGYKLAGHLHPGALLTGAGRQTLQLPCFWFGPDGGVLPAFGRFTGTAPIRPSRADRVYVTTDHAVLHIHRSE